MKVWRGAPVKTKMKNEKAGCSHAAENKRDFRNTRTASSYPVFVNTWVETDAEEPHQKHVNVTMTTAEDPQLYVACAAHKYEKIHAQPLPSPTCTGRGPRDNPPPVVCELCFFTFYSLLLSFRRRCCSTWYCDTSDTFGRRLFRGRGKHERLLVSVSVSVSFIFFHVDVEHRW